MKKRIYELKEKEGGNEIDGGNEERGTEWETGWENWIERQNTKTKRKKMRYWEKEKRTRRRKRKGGSGMIIYEIERINLKLMWKNFSGKERNE